MAKIILFNKPYDVLSQFTDQNDRTTLANYIDAQNFYPAGRLDRDSEGLLILTDSGPVQHRIADPRHKLKKTYWAQVENIPSPLALQQLSTGIELKDGLTRPAQVKLIEEPTLWPRTPPIRQRAAIPAAWIELTISEGRNRQVRRMTAAIGHPTLRLIRCAVGPWTLSDLTPGQWRTEDVPAQLQIPNKSQRFRTKPKFSRQNSQKSRKPQ